MIAVRMSIGVDFLIPNTFPKGAQTGIDARMKKQRPKKAITRSDGKSQFFIRKRKKGNRSKAGSFFIFFIFSFDFFNLLPIIETERFLG